MNNLFSKLEKGQFFKLIMGVGNKDLSSIKKLAAIYASAGADMFDLTADENVFDSILEGLEFVKISQDDILFCVSFSIGKDVHGRKAYIDQKKCTKCKKCIKQCPHDAIYFEVEKNKVFIKEEKCIGCAKCDCKAISYKKEEVNVLEKLSVLYPKYKIDCIEIHLSSFKKEEKELILNIKKKYPTLPIGICVSRQNFSDKKELKLIKEIKEIIAPQKLILQADGIAMSGGKDDLVTSLQAVANANVLQKEDVFILVSGGVNSKTKELAKLLSTKINGISVGSYGRLLVKDELNNEDIWYNTSVFNSALKKAQILVDSVKKE